MVFGGLGQDDIIGGSSDFFSLMTRGDRARRRRHHLRRRRRCAPATTTCPLTDMHARDADTIVGDNGQIIRIVGINRHSTSVRATKYVSFTYDNALRPSGSWSAASTLLDYTPGGPTSGPTCSAPPAARCRPGRRHRRRATRCTARPATTRSTPAAGNDVALRRRRGRRPDRRLGQRLDLRRHRPGRHPRRRRPHLHQPQHATGVTQVALPASGAPRAPASASRSTASSLCCRPTRTPATATATC